MQSVSTCHDSPNYIFWCCKKHNGDLLAAILNFPHLLILLQTYEYMHMVFGKASEYLGHWSNKIQSDSLTESSKGFVKKLQLIKQSLKLDGSLFVILVIQIPQTARTRLCRFLYGRLNPWRCVYIILYSILYSFLHSSIMPWCFLRKYPTNDWFPSILGEQIELTLIQNLCDEFVLYRVGKMQVGSGSGNLRKTRVCSGRNAMQTKKY